METPAQRLDRGPVLCRYHRSPGHLHKRLAIGPAAGSAQRSLPQLLAAADCHYAFQPGAAGASNALRACRLHRHSLHDLSLHFSACSNRAGYAALSPQPPGGAHELCRQPQAS